MDLNFKKISKKSVDAQFVKRIGLLYMYNRWTEIK